ncbi:MAG: EAL domain-containing protein [Actinomycetota bacterium]|nr:EAL domain-containing protein [Actinomycetota bacterium]
MIYGSLLLVALALTRRGRQRWAVALVCSGFLIATLIVVSAQPFLVPVVILAPLLAVGVALPSAPERTLKYMFAAAWLVAVAVGVLGGIMPSNSSLPNWYKSVFSIAALATAVAVVLLLLWQYRNTLVGTISQMRVAEERAVYDARHDSLTRLPNRALFMEHLERTLERSRRDSKYRCAVLFLDLDRFKNINDSLGHLAGDLLLKETARRLARCVHPTDMVARLGGDEFTILLENMADSENAARIAERICADLEMPFKIDGQNLYSTGSVGIVPNLAEYITPEEILRDADTAMYWAKKEGKARYKTFEVRMRERAIRLMRLESDLRRALERQEFVLHYQPIVSLKSGEIIRFEALVRWAHPEKGVIYPQEFIPLAEETELVVPLGLSVLWEACAKTKAWHTRFPDRQPLSVAVNVSPVQLTQPGFAEQIGETVQRTGLDGRYLCLEITESTMMKDLEVTSEVLQAIRNQGVRVHIDDFGTGYSSLELLHRLHVDALKIDRSFVDSLEGDTVSGETAQIVETMVTLAHGLGMDAVAEGVSTPEQVSCLEAIGCDYAQGFHFSKPVDARAAEGLFASHVRR